MKYSKQENYRKYIRLDLRSCGGGSREDTVCIIFEGIKIL
jgi:hypothetical protein